jgi:hypothetical protein
LQQFISIRVSMQEEAMKKLDIPRISLAEAVLFAQESAAIDEAQRQLDLNRQIGDDQRITMWRNVLAELQHPHADAA